MKDSAPSVGQPKEEPLKLPLSLEPLLKQPTLGPTETDRQEDGSEWDVLTKTGVGKERGSEGGRMERRSRDNHLLCL